MVLFHTKIVIWNFSLMKVRGISGFIGLELCTGLHSGEHTVTYEQYCRITELLNRRMQPNTGIYDKYTVEQYYAKGDWMLTVYNSGSIARVFNGKQRKWRFHNDIQSVHHIMMWIHMNIGRILRNRLTCGFQIKQNCELETFCRHMWYLMIRRDGKAGRQVTIT